MIPRSDWQMEIVGYMLPKLDGWGYHIVCANCATRNEAGEINLTAIYRINIEPYRQTCMKCKKVLVEGAKGWCELYD